MRDSRYPLLSAFAALLLAAPGLAQRTWIVAPQPGPGVDFTDLPPAIAVAAPGDRIEASGTSSLLATYSSIFVDKALDIEATQAARMDSIRVENLPAGQLVRIAGFRCVTTPTNAAPDNCLLIRNCAGTVLLTNLDIRNSTGDRIDGFRLENCAAVVLQDVTALGNSGGINPGGPALFVNNSSCSLVRCTLRGGDGGGSISNAAGYRGGDAVQVVSGSMLAAHCSITGGHGGYGFFVPGDGGTAVYNDLLHPATLTLLGSTLTQGQGFVGQSIDGNAVDGVARVTADCVVTGPLQNGATTVPAMTTLQSNANVQQGGTLDLTFEGAAGTLIMLGFDVRAEHRLVPGFAEPWLLTPNCWLLGYGVLPGSPTTISYHVPHEPVLHQLSLWFQAAAFEASARATMTPVAVTRVE